MSDEKRYQVFISSTFLDLQEERQKVLQAILEMKAFPTGMELFPSADEEQFDFIKREIDSSDYYVLILAGKYGSLSPSGISFTELEYDYAVSKGKPVIRLLHHDISNLIASKVEVETDLRAKLTEFRNKVKADRLCKMYLNPDDLKAKVWQSLSSEMALKPGVGWMRADQVRRIDDLAQITELQKEVMELRSRLQAMEAGPERLLPNGNDVYEFTATLSESIRTSHPECPESFSFAATWNSLLVKSFSKDYPHPSWLTVRGALRKYVGNRLKDQVAIALTEDELDSAFTNMMSFMSRCRIMFLGKGLMKIDTRLAPPNFPGDEPEVQEHWVLTEKGLATCASIAFKKKAE